jgi:hypothetical protein
MHRMKSSLSSVAECTVPEKILLAALQLEERGESPFSAEALIVNAWQKYPRTFGLKGFADQYPDSNKVLSSIMGVRGLAGRGWLAKVGQKLYTLTREGRQVIRRLQQGGEVPPAAQRGVQISPEQEKFLTNLWSTPAVEKYQEGRRPELNFNDALGFWGVSESMRGPTVNARLDQLRATLTELELLLAGGDATLSNGRCLVQEDIQHLQDLDTYLSERFSRHLNLLRSRVGRT